ncbi:hypothetical protein AMTRI_Chr04g250810 [Amborella trichopoda]
MALEAWDFFGGGQLKIKGLVRFGIVPECRSWTRAKDILPIYFAYENQEAHWDISLTCKTSSVEGLLETHDFRMPKPEQCHKFGRDDPEPNRLKCSVTTPTIGVTKDTSVCKENFVSANITSKFRPHFMRRAPKKGSPQADHKNRLSQIAATAEKQVERIIPDQAATNDRLTVSKTERQALSKKSACKGSNTKQRHGSLEISSADISKAPREWKAKQINPVNGFHGTADFPEGEVSKVETQGEKPSKIQPKISKLGSLTIPELKMFLTTKKAKVGGKKEELIQRVTGLLT